MKCLLRDRQGGDRDPIIVVKLETGQPPEGCDVLILLSDRLTEQVDLDVRGVLGELARGDVLAVKRVQSTQETDREGSGGAETGAGGDVGHRDDLDTRLHAVGRDDLTDDPVLDLLGACDALEG